VAENPVRNCLLCRQNKVKCTVLVIWLADFLRQVRYCRQRHCWVHGQRSNVGGMLAKSLVRNWQAKQSEVPSFRYLAGRFSAADPQQVICHGGRYVRVCGTDANAGGMLAENSVRNCLLPRQNNLKCPVLGIQVADFLW
jgi:hypothetical protein